MHRKKPYPWQKRRRRALLAVLALIATISTLAGWRAHVRHAVQKRVSALREQGFPVTCEELRAWRPTVAAEANAAPHYERALLTMSKLLAEDAALQAELTTPFVGPAARPPQADEMEAFERVSSTCAPVLELLHTAASFKQCRFAFLDSPWFFGRVRLAFGWDEARGAAKLLTAQAVWLAAKGQTDKALEALEDTFALAHALVEVPVLDAQYLVFDTHDRAFNAMQCMLAGANLNDDQLDRLARLLDAREYHGQFIRALAGERALVLEHMQRFAPSMLKVLGLWDRGIAASLDLIEALIETSQLPLPQAIAQHQDLWAAYRQGNPWYAAPLEFTQLSGQPMWKALRHRGWHDASLCAARAAVDIERYRAAHGTLPATLDPLVPEFIEAVPPDPFDSAPLRYRLLDPGYVVYSIGPNLTDDQAAAVYGNRSAAMRKGDVAFRVRR